MAEANQELINTYLEILENSSVQSLINMRQENTSESFDTAAVLACAERGMTSFRDAILEMDLSGIL